MLNPVFMFNWVYSGEDTHKYNQHFYRKVRIISFCENRNYTTLSVTSKEELQQYQKTTKLIVAPPGSNIQLCLRVNARYLIWFSKR